MNTKKRYLGIDYGTKRIGVAISDEEAVLAFPKEILLNNGDTLDRLAEIIKADRITDIVMGESVDFTGKLNTITARINVFALELEEKFKLPIHKQKEFLTSVEARRYENGGKKITRSQAHSKLKQIKSGRIDARAAALILQRYLDKKNQGSVAV